jgi:transaldolase/glucose-6-phosphate isomerase
MSKLNELTKLGQAIWLDYIRRSFTESGGLQDLVNQGVRGVTSNPTIFEKAIAGSADYDKDLIKLVESGKSVDEIYESLAIEDIKQAADVLRKVYDQSNGEDGYVSLEVSPTLAHDTEGTISEAVRLFSKLDRPNIMIKIPATKAGIPAIQSVIGQGVNVNVTLLFSLEHYKDSVEAYIAGLETLVSNGGDVSKIASVASFFVSRVDSIVDQKLEAAEAPELQGKIAIANAKVAYTCFQEIFSGERWEKLAAQGARVQRPLWASTSTKNPDYPDTLYVDNLIGLHTVNTTPPKTLTAFMDHGQVESTLDKSVDEARNQLSKLAETGINLNAITEKLQEDGVASFAKSFETLMSSISKKRQELLNASQSYSSELGSYQSQVNDALDEIVSDQIVARIWDHDHTVWKPEPEEITNRLGWLRIAETMQAALPRLQTFVEKAQSEGFTHAVLLGMGGSSLAPEVFRKTFGVRDGYLDLSVLDSTDPDTVLALSDSHDLSKTLFIVATKSGGTVETLSFFKYFYNQVAAETGAEKAGSHFIAITDPGSKLVDLAEKHNFRETFLNDPNIGGRYSALSYFGLVPAALLGLDLERLLDSALGMAAVCESSNASANGNTPCVHLGAAMGALAKSGCDKLTLVLSPEISSFGDWVEQLIAESTGKQGLGILPVVGETIGQPSDYGLDRLFVSIRVDNDSPYDTAIEELKAVGFPVIQIELKDIYALGGQFFLWEFATAIAGYRLQINPFDQPNVESAKVLARKMTAAYQEDGKLPELTHSLEDENILVYSDIKMDNVDEMLRAFISQGKPGSYISLQAYVQPTPEIDASLLELRTGLRDFSKLVATSGYGPRFLHSTGQLHKGDAGNGLFIQITSNPQKDAEIPNEAGTDDSSMSFGVLKMAQALGDRQALLDAGRNVITFHMQADIPKGIMRLTNALE